jgi:hypothetical protein
MFCPGCELVVGADGQACSDCGAPHHSSCFALTGCRAPGTALPHLDPPTIVRAHRVAATAWLSTLAIVAIYVTSRTSCDRRSEMAHIGTALLIAVVASRCAMLQHSQSVSAVRSSRRLYSVSIFFLTSAVIWGVLYAGASCLRGAPLRVPFVLVLVMDVVPFGFFAIGYLLAGACYAVSAGVRFARS